MLWNWSETFLTRQLINVEFQEVEIGHVKMMNIFYDSCIRTDLSHTCHKVHGRLYW